VFLGFVGGLGVDFLGVPGWHEIGFGGWLFYLIWPRGGFHGDPC